MDKKLLNGKCYCVKCNKETSWSSYPVEEMRGLHDNKHYIFTGLQARCDVCTKMVFPDVIKEYNQEMFEKAIKNNDLDV